MNRDCIGGGEKNVTVVFLNVFCPLPALLVVACLYTDPSEVVRIFQYSLCDMNDWTSSAVYFMSPKYL